jgi:pimeloyl-ACP methyl ester carboxylesterase
MTLQSRIARHETRIGVGVIDGQGPFELAATVIAVPASVDAVAPVLLVCWPGGSYGRTYWDLDPGSDVGYSAAEHWALQGYIVVTADQLGVGDSDRPHDGDAVRIAHQAAAGDALVRSLRGLAAAGELHPGFPPLDSLRLVGVGHSLGGSLVITQQALHGSYDAIANVGFTQGDKGAVDAPEDTDESDLEALALAQVGAFFAGSTGSYGLPTKADSRSWLYGPQDEPRIVDEDITVSVPWPRGPYAEALLPGRTAAYAAAVECPVFIGFSEIDIPEFPRREPDYFPACGDVTLFVLPDAAHCSNFSPQRKALWDRISTWEQSVTSQGS